MAASLLLARDGHGVTLLERDAFDAGSPGESAGWSRRGIPHFLQPHAFIPRGVAELDQSLPDVLSAIVDAGARVVDVRPKLPGPPEPADSELRYLAARRPLIEWALRRAVRGEARVEVRCGSQIEGIRVEDGRVTGVGWDGATVSGDLYVDALGRRTPTTQWLGEAGVVVPEVQSSDCSVIYYSRYYRQRPGFDLPDGPWFLSPRGDLGYMAYATFPGDNGTFAGLLAVPTGVPEWRHLKRPAVYEAVVERIPGLAQWADPAGVEPITEVMPMAGLRNTFRAVPSDWRTGLVPIGDALSHTDPVLAHGLAFALVHARELVAALHENADLDDACATFGASTAGPLRERYEFASELDEQRHRMWTGEPVDYSRPGGDYALFSVQAAGAAAFLDPEIARVFVRRMGLLDSTSVLDGNPALQVRIERRFGEIQAQSRPPLGPPLGEMLATVGDAIAKDERVTD